MSQPTSIPNLVSPATPPSGLSTPSEMPGTPTSTTTSLSALSTTAIKDGHRGSSTHPSFPFPLTHSTLESERADRISRLTGLAGVPNRGRVLSTVGSASATGSVGRTNDGLEAGEWDGSAPGGYDSADEESSVVSRSEAGGSVVSAGYGRRGGGSVGGGNGTVGGFGLGYAQGGGPGAVAYGAPAGMPGLGEGGRVGAEAAERIVRRLDGGEAKEGRPLGTPEGDGLGRFYFEEKR